MKTDKLYYEDMFRKECEATIIKIEGEKIICDRTIAFPEGGGQIGDKGYIYFENGEKIQFFNTKKGVGDILHLNIEHDIQINTPVYHIVDGDSLDRVNVLPGEKVKIRIDPLHRIQTTVHHSALHLVLMAASDLRSGIETKIKGCHIGTEKARIDFFIKDKFNEEDVKYINNYVNELILENVEVERYLFQNQKEAWIWKCKNFECPCGGTHVMATGQIGNACVKRKNVGKATERLIVTAENVEIYESMYH